MPRKAKENSQKSLSHPRFSIVLPNSAIASACNLIGDFELARGAEKNPLTNGTVPDMVNVTEVKNGVQQSVEGMHESFSSWINALRHRHRSISWACAVETSCPGEASFSAPNVGFSPDFVGT